MQFTLTYRGPLKANGSASDKMKLRRRFHPQLRQLWELPPLDRFREWIRVPAGSGGDSVIQPSGPFLFAPLVSERNNMLAELDLTLLRKGRPGEIVHDGGDIDNRMKTLFDALRIPKPSELPPAEMPQADETPLYCLLDDDKLIARLSVDTDTLLDGSDPREVVLLIRVETRVVHRGVAVWALT